MGEGKGRKSERKEVGREKAGNKERWEGGV